MPLGNAALAKESELNEAFASGRIDDAALHRILAELGRLQSELRYTHLKYHLATRSVLSPDQIAASDCLARLRQRARASIRHPRASLALSIMAVALAGELWIRPGRPRAASASEMGGGTVTRTSPRL